MPTHILYHGCAVQRPEHGGQVMLCGQRHVVDSKYPPKIVDDAILPGGHLTVALGVLTAASVAASAVTSDGSPVKDCLMDLGGESFDFGREGPLQWHRDQVMGRSFSDDMEQVMVINRGSKTVRFMLTVLPEEMIDSTPVASAQVDDHAEAEVDDHAELLAVE